MKTKTSPTTNLMIRSSRDCGAVARLLIPMLLVCFGLLSRAQAVVPAPDGGYPNNNTAEGQDALFSLTPGLDNTANGFQALYSNTFGSANTATGRLALFSNTTGSLNTATGDSAL